MYVLILFTHFAPVNSAKLKCFCFRFFSIRNFRRALSKTRFRYWTRTAAKLETLPKMYVMLTKRQQRKLFLYFSYKPQSSMMWLIITSAITCLPRILSNVNKALANKELIIHITDWLINRKTIYGVNLPPRNREKYSQSGSQIHTYFECWCLNHNFPDIVELLPLSVAHLENKSELLFTFTK